jgi:nitrogen regulatory protein P-II 2
MIQRQMAELPRVARGLFWHLQSICWPPPGGGLIPESSVIREKRCAAPVVRLRFDAERSSEMKMIEAIIKPHKLDAVKTALARMGILGVTAVECKGFGRQLGHTERYRGAEMDVSFVAKVLLKVCVKDEDWEKAVGTITEAGRSGEVGDGKIFVSSIQRVVRIRTGEQDEQAL